VCEGHSRQEQLVGCESKQGTSSGPGWWKGKGKAVSAHGPRAKITHTSLSGTLNPRASRVAARLIHIFYIQHTYSEGIIQLMKTYISVVNPFLSGVSILPPVDRRFPITDILLSSQHLVALSRHRLGSTGDLTCGRLDVLAIVQLAAADLEGAQCNEEGWGRLMSPWNEIIDKVCIYQERRTRRYR
jgi:hypothetical protein